MNAETALLQNCNDPQFLVVTGSRLYGTARYDENGVCISDWDLRGWALPPWEYMLEIPGYSFVEREIAKPPEGDHKITNLKSFLTNLLKQDPQSFELLFAPDEHVHKMTPIARELRNMRHLFVTKNFYWRIAGYGNSEWRKARAVRVEIEEPPKQLDDILAWIRNTIPGVGKANMDQIYTWLTEHLPRIEVSSKAGINGKRRDEYAKYGYCTSSACHSVRLMNQCREFLETGHMTFPRPDAALLSNIKHGRMKIEEIEPIYLEASAKCKEAFEKTTLPDNVDQGRIWGWYKKIIALQVISDERIREDAFSDE